METVIIPNFRFLNEQFACLEVFLGGTRTLHNHFMKGNIAGTNAKMAATLITKKLERFYKKSDEVHPHILRFTNLLTDTIFSIHPEFLTKNPNNLVIKSDKKDAKESFKTTKPVFDKEERSNLSKWIDKLKGMVVKHKEYVHTMEKEAKTFYSLQEKIQCRESVIRQKFSGSDTDTFEEEIEYTLLNDFALRFHKQAFRTMGFAALKSHAKAMEKKVQLENEMKQTEFKIISSIKASMKQRLFEALSKLVRIHELKCISKTSVSNMQRNMIKLADGISDVICDITETNSTQYSFKPSCEDQTRFGLIRNIRNMDDFLMGRTIKELLIDIPNYVTKHFGLQTTNFGDLLKATSNYRNCKTIKIDQQNNPTLIKSKGIVRQTLYKDNLIFGWTKSSSMFSSKKEYGFYVLNKAVTR